MDRALNTKQASEVMGRTQQTLAEWRWHGKGPAYFRMGGRIHYKVEDLEKFMYANRIDPEAEAKRKQRQRQSRRRKRVVPGEVKAKRRNRA